MDWDLVPAPRLIKIWNDYMKTGFVRDEKGIDMIAEIILTNIAKLNVNTILCGHEQQRPPWITRETSRVRDPPRGILTMMMRFLRMKRAHGSSATTH